MLRPILVPWAALALFCPALAFGQSGADLIPDDATLALSINSISGVRDKGEQFIKDHRLKVERRPSAAFKALFNFFHIKKGIDEKGAAAFVVPNLKKSGIEKLETFEDFLDVLQLLYLVVPVKDVREMAGNFGLKAEGLKSGKLLVANSRGLLLRGKHLYVGMSKKALALVSTGKPLTAAVGTAQKEALTKSDLALHIGSDALGKIYRKALDEAERALKRKDARDDSQSKQLIDALRQLRFVVGGLSLDEGGKINIIATFQSDKEGAAARKFLAALRAGPGTSDLVGLPNGRPVFLFAARGDGTSNVAMARALVNILFDQARIDKALPGADRGAFVASFERLYRELKGSRAALYANKDDRQGRFAFVGILDIGDTEKHLAEMPILVKRLNSAAANVAREHGGKPLVFSYEGKAEKLDGLEANLLSVKAPGMSRTERAIMEEQLGPDWGKVRIAVVGKKVAFLAGSNVGLLKEAIANIKGGKKGLAADKTVTAELGRVSKARKVELHFNLQGLALQSAGKRPGAVRGLTSFALAVEPEYVQLEIVGAKSEVRPFAQLIGLAEK